MPSCTHEKLEPGARLFLNRKFRGRDIGIYPFRYCAKCGLVKESGGKSTRSLEYYLAQLAYIHENIHPLRLGQMRLICRHLETFIDPWGDNSYNQDKFFIELVLRYSAVTRAELTGLFTRTPARCRKERH
jgi:hypothetical protein